MEYPGHTQQPRPALGTSYSRTELRRDGSVLGNNQQFADEFTGYKWSTCNTTVAGRIVCSQQAGLLPTHYQLLTGTPRYHQLRRVAVAVMSTREMMTQKVSNYSKTGGGVEDVRNGQS